MIARLLFPREVAIITLRRCWPFDYGLNLCWISGQTLGTHHMTQVGNHLQGE